MRVLEAIDAGRLIDFSSEMARIEVGRIPEGGRRRSVAALLPPRSRVIKLDESILNAAERLMKIGFASADSVHLSAARRLGVEVFLTVDDKLLRRAHKYAMQVGVRVVKPVSFVEELGHDDDR